MAAGFFTTKAVTRLASGETFERAHGRGIGQPRGNSGAWAVEAASRASLHPAVDFLLLGDDVAGAGEAAAAQAGARGRRTTAGQRLRRIAGRCGVEARASEARIQRRRERRDRAVGGPKATTPGRSDGDR